MMFFNHQQDSEGFIVFEAPAQHADALVGDAVVAEVEMHQRVVEF